MDYRLYEKLVADETISLLYKEADSEDHHCHALHGKHHVLNVVNTCTNILTELGCDKATIECGKIAAYLHDVGASEGKQGHTERSYEFALNYLKDKKLKVEEYDRIVFAILNHSEGCENADIVCSALVLSDKLDMDKTRLAPLGYSIDGLSQIQYIDKIEVKINDNVVVNVTASEQFNKEKFEEYYFSKKMFNAITSFAKTINKPSFLLINNKIW